MTLTTPVTTAPTARIGLLDTVHAGADDPREAVRRYRDVPGGVV